MTQDMRRSIVRAIGSSSLISLFTKLMSLTSTLVLVRLLTPSDYGLVAIAVTITGVIGFFNEIGLGSAIVQRQQAGEDEINGCFGIALIASTILVLIMLVLSWPMAVYYAMPELRAVLVVLGLSLYFGAVNTVPLSLLRKSLRFQAVLGCSAFMVAVQAVVAIPLAYAGLRYWSIVVGFVVGQFAGTLWYWVASGWRPYWPMDLRQGRALMGYGLNITATRVLWHLYMNADKLIIGKVLGAYAVGLYDVARSLANLPTSQISGVATNIASPVYARLQADRPRLREAMVRLVRGVAYLALPILFGMAVLADDLVATLAGPQWGGAVWPLRALCFVEMVASVANLQTQLLISSGNVRRLVRYNMLCALVLPLALALGAWQGGLIGVALAWALVYPLVYSWLLREVLRLVEMRLAAFMGQLTPPFFGALLMGGVVLGVRGMMPAVSPLVGLVTGSAVGAVVYVAYVIYADRRGLAEIRQVLSDLGLPQRHLAQWPFTRLDVKGVSS